MKGIILVNRAVVVIGAGGHAKVLINTLKKKQVEILGATTAEPKIYDQILGIPILGDDSIIASYKPDAIYLVNGVGHLPGVDSRYKIYEHYKALGYSFLSVIDPSAIISSDAEIEEGVQIMAGVILQPGIKIQANSIINTGVSIDHDCLIGRHCHLAPRVTLCGGVSIGNFTFVGAGSIIIQSIHVAEAAIIAAASLVCRNILSAEKFKENANV